MKSVSLQAPGIPSSSALFVCPSYIPTSMISCPFLAQTTDRLAYNKASAGNAHWVIFILMFILIFILIFSSTTSLFNLLRELYGQS